MDSGTINKEKKGVIREFMEMLEVQLKENGDIQKRLYEELDVILSPTISTKGESCEKVSEELPKLAYKIKSMYMELLEINENYRNMLDRIEL